MNSFSDLSFIFINQFNVGYWEFMKQNPHYVKFLTSNILFILLIIISIIVIILIEVGLLEKIYILIFNVLFVKMGKDKKREEAINNNIQWLTSYTSEDAILSLLYAKKDSPINGRLMFVKQLFLFANEVVPELNEKLKFFPYDFGPYSQEFAKTINKLIEEKIVIIEISQIEDKVSYRFCLSEEGKKRAEQSFNKLPDSIQEVLRRKRRGWDQLGYTGIVRLVYSKYPEYIVASKIKDEVNE